MEGGKRRNDPRSNRGELPRGGPNLGALAVAILSGWGTRAHGLVWEDQRFSPKKIKVKGSGQECPLYTSDTD